MKTTTWMAFAGLALVGALMSVSWIHSRRARAGEVTRAAVERDCRLAEEKIRRTEQQIERLTADESGLRSAIEALRKAKAAPAKPAENAARRAWSIADRLKAEPELQAVWLISRRAELATRYNALMRQLRLLPEQRAQFEAIELRREERELDLRSVEGSKGISASEPAMLTLRKQVQSDYDNSMRELLGDDGLQQKKEYDRTTTIREMVNGIAGGAVVVTRTPLTAEQGERLIQIMAEASGNYQKGGRASSGDLNWDAIDAQARTVLSDSQFAMFKNMEPPLPLGARHQAQLYRLVEEAKKVDAANVGAIASPSSN